VSAKYCPPFPVEAVDIVDTNGCGDAFVGGFLAAIAQGAGGDASVAAGHLCARHVLKATGVPTELAALGPWRREQISL
jgi:adenosine kinase